MAGLDLFRLEDRVAVVTGGARGIGRTCARAFAQCGAHLALLDVHEENLATAKDELSKLGVKVETFVCDVAKSADVAQAAAGALQAFHRVDILFNSAGIALWADAEKMTEDEWDQVININLKGTFLCCQAFGRQMIEQKKGSIVNVASMSASIVNKPQSQCSYNASKAGVVHLTKSLAVEWAPHGVRVNCISPGYTLTPMVVKLPEYHDGWKALVPMGRLAEPEEIAGGVLYLASDAASYTTGHDLVIDGGYSLW